MHLINLATEDELSESVGLRLISELGPVFKLDLRLRRGGYGYLRSNLKKFCHIARQTPMLLIADLDRHKCAAELIGEWMKQRKGPTKLLFRIAVREVESWLLADHEAMKSLLGKDAIKLPTCPDSLKDPKRALLELAKKAPREVRDDLLADNKAIASQGLGYNQRLCGIVRDKWNPERAALRSDSLRRARIRLQQLAAHMHSVSRRWCEVGDVGRL